MLVGSSSEATPQTISLTADQEYILHVLNDCGDTIKSDTVVVTVNSVISVPVIDTIGSICTNVNAILTTTAQSGGTINWYSDAGLIINVGVGPVLNLGNVTTPGEHIYYATETVGGCESAGVSYVFWTSECPPYPCATNLLTNGDFENYISCPDDGFSIYQDSAVTVTNWQNGIIDIVSGSSLTPDYFNTNCSYSNTANYTAPYPSPNGAAYAGVISTAPFGSPNKEMLGMMYDLKECQEYSLQLKIVQGETLFLPGVLTTDIVIYGGVSGGLPLLSPTICPLAQGFEIMGTIPAGSIDSLWRTFNLTFSPSGNYDCFIIGADCTNPSTGFDAILVDDVFLCVDPCVNMATNILPINLASDTCSSNTGSGSVDFTTNCYTGFDFVWLDGALNTVSTDSMAIGLAAGTYTVQVTDSNNCMIDATVVIPNIPSFVATLTTNSPICENQLLSLSAFPSGLSAGSYSWVGPNGSFGGAGLSTVDIIPIGNPIAGGWYYVTVDDGTCTGVDSAFVISNSTYNIFDTIAICSGTNYTYADGAISNNIIVDESHISSLTTVESCDSIVREFLVVGTNATPVIVTPNSWYCVGDNIADLITVTGDIWYSDVSLATQVGTGASFTPPSIVGVTNYYVVDTTGGCFSLPDSIAIEFVNCITCVGNLVPNPSFETNTGLPSALGQYNLVDNWSNSGGPTAFSADYFHTNGIGVAQLPTTSLLTSMPNSGNATMGAIIYSFASNYREYINVQLTSPLIVGTTYDVSFYVTAGQFNGNAGGTGANNIGAHFSVGAITQPAGSAPFNIVPVFNYNTVFYDSNWVQMSFQYTATTPIDYLTVGNFYDDAGTTAIIYDTLSSGFNQAIIMYDDFCVTAVSVPVSGYAVSDTAFCEGTCITITDASTSGDTWEWTFNGGTPATSIIQNPETVCFNAAGIYTIEQIVTNSFGSDTTTSTVEVFPSPIIDTGEGVILELGGSTTLNATGGGVNAVYTWDPVDWLTCIECSTTIATPEETITYTVSVVDSSGCVATNDVTIIVNYDNVVWTPNIFSANGDGLNDVFYVRGPIHPENFTLIIYSRWGEKIFETTDPTLGWDGTFRGKPLNTAVFAYIATGSTLGGAEFELKGNITLIVK
jgi:gliding motility-associated-like protein